MSKLEENRFDVVDAQSFNDELTTQLDSLIEKDVRIILGNFNQTWARYSTVSRVTDLRLTIVDLILTRSGLRLTRFGRRLTINGLRLMRSSLRLTRVRLRLTKDPVCD